MSRSSALTLTALLIAGMCNTTFADPGGSGGQRGGPSASKSEGALKSEDAETGKSRYETQTKEQTREKAPDKGEQTRAQEQTKERVREPGQGKGNETSEEKQAQREERKQIQEEYRADGPQSGEGKAKKKPWWKFWEDDESS